MVAAQVVRGEALAEQAGGIADAVAGITVRLYGDIPADEADAAARVLTLITQRANAELAAIPT
ncbi:hypothetical protein [Micromonospora sp. ALFpr18c]|uniref:hypothetical protein n=1 Tax=unclassified Micromonospora TaxID=2617518 RepID=UPI001CED6BD7|nr:hypothetical protein [Micromonospora sp. ALFpr18c]